MDLKRSINISLFMDFYKTIKAKDGHYSCICIRSMLPRTARDIPGQEVPLGRYQGKVLLIVNQFGAEEPGTEAEIQSFCQLNYGATFRMFAKVEVNGDGAGPGRRALRAEGQAGGHSGRRPAAAVMPVVPLAMIAVGQVGPGPRRP